MKDSILNLILHAIDWTSVKLTAVVIPFLFIPSWLLQTLGAAAMLSTLLYNTVRIIKEVWPLVEPAWEKIKLKFKNKPYE